MARIRRSFSSSAYMAMAMIGGGATTGYAIKQGLERVATFFWTASYGQIYPDLRKLEAAGLITGRDRSSGGRQRREYALTDEGEAELQRWLAGAGRTRGLDPPRGDHADDARRLGRPRAGAEEPRRAAPGERRAARERSSELEPPLERGIRIKDLGERITATRRSPGATRPRQQSAPTPSRQGQPPQGRSAGGRLVFRGIDGTRDGFRLVLASALAQAWPRRPRRRGCPMTSTASSPRGRCCRPTTT